VGILVLQYFWTEAQHVKTIPYSEFETLLKEGKISEVVVGSRIVQGTLMT